MTGSAREVFIVAGRRTAVAPRGGAFGAIEAHALAAAPIGALLTAAGAAPDAIDGVILGNALYGGGNPARVAALAAGLAEAMPAVTVDTQCCAGLDAILAATAEIRAGEAHLVVAGGVESFSRSPLRFRRPRTADESPQGYERPPFTPWADRDPDMIPAAARLAAELEIGRGEQEAYAVESHRKALGAAAIGAEIAPLAGLARDSFTRRLEPRLCARLPALSVAAAHAVTAATDPERPGLAPIAAGRRVLERSARPAAAIVSAEIMEAFAVQAIACLRGLALDPAIVNRNGGALARGHPIGASGAILAVRLWHDLQDAPAGALGLAAIAAAGGLGTALLVERSE
ncbi:putative acetyl-CoA acyltransferase [bacterium YEK0313]|nr:putative acetyl-CoA acyltransferase [bacterium YEK0313]